VLTLTQLQSQQSPRATVAATIYIPGETLPMTTASRTSGVAPLAVFFDAVNDTATNNLDTFGFHRPTYAWASGVTQPADMEGATWAWNFGDAGSGTWDITTGLSKNTATGYTAAHVFESPGTYNVTLRVTQVNGTTADYTQTVTVTAFSGATRYVAASPTGNDGNAGTTTGAPWATVGAALAWVNGAANRRVLFRRGDTWNVSTQYPITATGPNIIGAYGDSGAPGHTDSDPRPIMICGGYTGAREQVFENSSGDDWRVMDLDMRPATAGDVNLGSVGYPSMTAGTNLLILRIRAAGFDNAIAWNEYGNANGCFIVSCEVPPTALRVSIYVGARRLAILGTLAYDSPGTHILRVTTAHKFVLSNNHFLRPSGRAHALKLHGPAPEAIYDGLPETRWGSITDNRFDCGAGATTYWTVSMGSQSNAQVEASYVTHLIMERNKFNASAVTTTQIETEASHVVVRNNIFNDTTGNNVITVWWTQRNAYLSTPHDVRLYNNTIYNATASTDATGFIQSDSAVSDLRVRNNLYGVSSTTNKSFVVSNGGTGWAQDHNSMTTAPGFTNASGGDFSLTVGSAAVNAGTALGEVAEDYLRATRPVNGTYDLGAYESH
jgi:hypothetical protein